MSEEMHNNTSFLQAAASERILILDGATGTMIQSRRPDESTFRGKRFASHPRQLKGCNDVLCLTAPDLIAGIHREYLDAGADIIETNSFNSTPMSLAEYGLEQYASEIAEAAARIARQTADSWEADHPGHKRWVAGSMGPTGKSLTMATTLGDAHPATWDELEEAYMRQASALLRGGADLLLIETVFDGLNAKAALHGARRAMEAEGREVPLMLSATLTESGRTLSGQTPEALLASTDFARPWSVGLNCGFGAEGLLPHLEALADAPALLSCHPNAGLPDELGRYTETPLTMAERLRPLIEGRRINIVGGCCGTTPDHIRAIAGIARGCEPRPVPQRRTGILTLAGLDALPIDRNRNFLNIGERCNVAGSRKFLRLIKEGATDEAVEIARAQVCGGASVIDINMDDAMLDSTAEMAAFVTRLGTEPDVARAPLMIDSSRPDTVAEALKRIQGKPVVNSISLKEGGEAFTSRAREIASMGAAMVVMLFDEEGQAVTFERRRQIASRAYRLLTDAGISPDDIIFDPNVLAVATGISEHSRYAADFLDAVEWIKKNLPGARTSGGLSNLSFSFRGNNRVREAMHSVFLYHAIARGLDMAIVNASALPPYDDIPADLRRAIEDVIFDTDPEATDRLTDMARQILDEKDSGTEPTAPADKPLTPAEAVRHMVMRGITDGLAGPLEELHASTGSAVAVIEGPLMDAMNRVGTLFGQGKMFLPQVVKSARVMQRAVELLTPAIESERHGNARAAGTMVIATVKGDVHDIGKNIVDVVMGCNGFRVVDLGVMVPPETIIDRAVAEKADFIGLSGLITPSLEEMCRVASLMQQRGLTIPLMIGGATTSELHTAVKIAPCYSGPVVHTRDAASLPAAARSFVTPSLRPQAEADLRRRQASLRDRHASETASPLSVAECRSLRERIEPCPVKPAMPGVHRLSFTAAEVCSLINWRAFFTAWQMDASLADTADGDTSPRAAEARALRRQAEEMLDMLSDTVIEAIVAILPAASQPETDFIVYEAPDGSRRRIPTVRRATPDESGHTLSLTDFLTPEPADGSLPDWIGMFAVTTGTEIARTASGMRACGDNFGSLLMQSLADRLAEAATEAMHRHVRQQLWGYENPDEAPENPGNPLRQYYRGIRPAVGYPSLPDQTLMRDIDSVLHLAGIGLSLTENCALNPAASTAGLIFAHPKSHYFIPGPLPASHQTDYDARRRESMPE